MTPTCTICGSNLEYTSEGWRCPIDKFFYQVFRGVAGKPLLNPPRQLEVPQEQQTQAAAPEREELLEHPITSLPTGKFRAFLAEHNISPEIYKTADPDAKEGLRTAYRQSSH